MSEKMIVMPFDLASRAAKRLANLNQPALASAMRGWVHNTNLGDAPELADEQAAAMAEKYPAYWRALPKHWLAVDTYRVNRLFPVDDPSGQLLHSRKKLLVPGCRTGGKSVYDDIKEAHATLGAWLADNKPE